LINKNVKKKKQDDCDHSHDQNSDDGEAKSGTNMVLIEDKKITELMDHRSFFGNPNFFKLFRSFYRLANIPEDA